MKSSLRKFLASVMIVCMLVAIIPCQTFAATNKGWRKVGKFNYRYYTSSTKYVKNSWKKINGSWYYFNKKGYRYPEYLGEDSNDNGNRVIKGKTYFFKRNGKLRTSQWVQLGGAWGGYTYVKKSGAMVSKGFHKIKGNWYYFCKEGEVNVRFDRNSYDWEYKDFTDSGKELCDYKGHLFTENGKAFKGWLYHYDARCDYWCYCDAKGKPAVGWKKIGGKWYYFKNERLGKFNAKGAMAYNCTLKINGKKYKFNSKGVCTNP